MVSKEEKGEDTVQVPRLQDPPVGEGVTRFVLPTLLVVLTLAAAPTPLKAAVGVGGVTEMPR